MNSTSAQPAPEANRTDTAGAGAPYDRVRWTRTAGFVLRSTRLALLLGVLGAAAATVTALLWPAQYTVTSMFYPVAPGGALSALSNLASAFGVGGTAVSPQSTPDFYAALIVTTPVLQAAVRRKYSFVDGRDTVSATLVKLWESSDATEGRSVADAMDDLLDAINVSTDETTGLVQFSVQTKWSELSVQISQEMLGQLDSLDQWAYTASAEDQRRFLDERLQAVGRDLHAAEDSLEAFLARNRDFHNDPALVVKSQRLQRRIDLSQAAYTTLDQNYEQARIEAARNTPAISIAVPPAPPVAEDKRHVGIKVAVGAVAGIFIAFLIVGVRDRWNREKAEHGDAVRALTDLRRDTVAGLRHPIRGNRRVH